MTLHKRALRPNAAVLHLWLGDLHRSVLQEIRENHVADTEVLGGVLHHRLLKIREESQRLLVVLQPRRLDRELRLIRPLRWLRWFRLRTIPEPGFGAHRLEERGIQAQLVRSQVVHRAIKLVYQRLRLAEVRAAKLW